MNRRSAILLAGLGCLTSPLAAQDSLLTELAQRFKSKPLSLGALLQVVGDYQNEGRATGVNGFRVANFRLKLSGELDGGYGYTLQTNFAASPAILDAELHYRVADGLVLQAGQFKAPFSRELLTGAGDLDFIDRSRVVTALAPNRQMGVEVRGKVSEGRVEYAAGVFNGNGIGSRTNDDDRVLVSGRLGWWLLGAAPGSASRLEVGGNLAYSEDASVSLGSLGAGFAGKRTVWGADLRYTSGLALLAVEVVGARLEPTGGSTANPHGWHLTVGSRPGARVQLLARWDAIRPDGLGRDSDLLVLGFRAMPTRAVQFRVNHVIDLDDADLSRHRFQAGAQLGF